MQRIICVIALSILLFYACACAALYILQRSFIYLPPPSGAPAPGFTQLRIEDGNINISLRDKRGPQALIYFGGNAEDVSQSLPLLAEAYPDHALYLPHYRGYGGSSGHPSEDALIADALALYDHVRTLHPRITVIGRSLGSGVAVHLASLRPVDELVLVTPYDSVEELAATQFPYFPVRWLLKDKYESWRYAPTVTAPTLIISAAQDEVIPAASTQRLLTRFSPGIAVMKTIADTGHNTISASPEYAALLAGTR